MRGDEQGKSRERKKRRWSMRGDDLEEMRRG
jgi:hypothetical protein